MAAFPGEIEYSKRLPSGRSAAAPITADVSVPYRALSQTGQAVLSIGQDLLEQERNLKVSEGQRRIVESINSAMESITGDEVQDNKLWTKLETDINNIQYGDSDVNNALAVYRNEKIPIAQSDFNSRHNLLRKQNVHDQFEAEGQTALARGDVTGYQELLQRRLETKDITQAEYDAKIKSAIPDSLLEQARDLMASDKPADNTRALGILENIQKIEGIQLTTEQKEYRDKILNSARKVNKQQIENYSQKYWQFLRAGDFNSIEADLNDPENPLPVAGDGGKNWWYNIIQAREEKLYQYDPQTRADILDTILFNPSQIDRFSIRGRIKQDIHGGLTLDQAQDYEEKFDLMFDKNSALNSPIARTFFNDLKQAKQDRVFSIEQMQNNERYGQSLDAMSDFFVAFRKKHDRDPSLTEAREFYDNLIKGYRSAAQPFTESKIQTTLGELESGGSYSVFGTVIPFRKPEDAINHVLRSLGPNWQKIAPNAAEIIKRKWPEADITTQKPPAPKETFEEGDRMEAYNAVYERRGGKWHKIRD